MNVAFYTLGCKLNYAETSQLQHLFEKEGHRVVPFGAADASIDAVIINTCTVTENADRECRQIVRRALRHSPQAFVGVTGCYAQLQPEEIASIEGVDAVFGAKEKFQIPALVPEFRKLDTPRRFVSELDDDLYFVEAHSAENDSRTRAFLKLQDGCNYKCSFCTIPLARGKSRSIDFGAIAQQVQALEDAGYHEIVLSGINIGDYKATTGERFADVVRLLDERGRAQNERNAQNAQNEARARLRISSIEPNLLTQEIVDMVARSSVFCPSFHIPLQSGSAEILRMMRRRYKVEHYRDLVRRIKAAMPHAAIGVDVIVGFPGETDAHFEETFRLLHELPISYLHVFSYSERENTPAAEYSAQGLKVPMHIRAERSKRLRSLSAKKKLEFYASQCGSVHTVIPETRNEAGRWLGWTENYVRVEFATQIESTDAESTSTGASTILQKPVQVRLRELGESGETVMADVLHTLPELAAAPAAEYAQPKYIPILM